MGGCGSWDPGPRLLPELSLAEGRGCSGGQARCPHPAGWSVLPAPAPPTPTWDPLPAGTSPGGTYGMAAGPLRTGVQVRMSPHVGTSGGAVWAYLTLKSTTPHFCAVLRARESVSPAPTQGARMPQDVQAGRRGSRGCLGGYLPPSFFPHSLHKRPGPTRGQTQRCAQDAPRWLRKLERPHRVNVQGEPPATGAQAHPPPTRPSFVKAAVAKRPNIGGYE